ncbi:MAG: hypothetical protein HYZ14_19745 [Bacteroidetes bacterium]|nr:hypothetical protein [Bacteroidota bacterium]
MATLNGIGTKFHGFRNCQPDGTADVTLWLVFLYFPIIPLRSYRIKRKATTMREFSYTVQEKIPLHFKSVLTTWFFGWIVTPILWFWPLPFAVREVGEYLGYTTENADGAFYYFVIAFAITYIVVFAWKWKDWDEKRGLPVKSK